MNGDNTNSTKSDQATNNLDNRLAVVTEKVREIVKHLDYHIANNGGQWCPYCYSIGGK